jgi:ribonuclease HI
MQRGIYLGGAAATTVYVAELHGIRCALQLAKHHLDQPIARPLRNINVFTDNQAALSTVASPGRRPGQSTVKQIAALVDHLRSRGTETRLHWVPAHIGVPGNEAADKLAKEAAEPSNRDRLPDQVWGATGLRAIVRERTATEWRKEWNTAKHGRDLHRLAPAPDRKVLLMHDKLRKADSAALIQARTGKIGLRKHLFDIARAETPWCLRCWDSRHVRVAETVRHVLTVCPAYGHLRGDLFRGAERDTADLLNDPARARDVVRFLLRTGALDQFRHVTPADHHPTGPGADTGTQRSGALTSASAH